MATKLQLYSSLANSTAENLTKSRSNWTGFLEITAKLYKYPYAEQMMIYAQRPDATACASIETWNKPMNRWVRRGSKGIALIDSSGSRPRLKYVFDVSDTEAGRQNARKPYLWEMQYEHEAPIMETLAKSYGEMEGNLGDILYNIAQELSKEYYEDNARDIAFSVEGSFLEELDDFNIGASFREALTVSTAYSLMYRCGLDLNRYFEDEDFQCIFDFNTPETVTALGTAVSELSEQVLREIGVVIRNYERQKAVERNVPHGEIDIHSSRGLSDSERDTERTAGGNLTTAASEQVRESAEELSSGTPSDPIQQPSSEREVISPSPGDRGNSKPEVGTDYDRATEEEPGTGQSDQSDGLDSAHEQPESTSGGNDSQRTDIRINDEPEIPPVQNEHGQGGIFGSSQIGENLRDTLLGTGISLEAVDIALRTGGNHSKTMQRIAAWYMKEKTPAENTDFIRQEYNTGGKGFIVNDVDIAVWWDKDGMTLGKGRSALQASEYVHLSWEQIADRIGELLETGQFASQDILDEALDNEFHEAADKLWFFYRDDLHNIPEAWNANGSGHPDSTATIKSLLEQPDQLNAIVRGLEADIYNLEHSETQGRRWHRSEVVLDAVKNLQIQPRSFVAGNVPIQTPSFITDDEVDTFLTRGSSIESSKFRIFSYFLHEHTPKERADFVKKEYKDSGSSHALSSADDSWYDGFRNKMELRRSYDKVELSWSKAANRINQLINDGRYMSQNDLALLPQYEKNILASEVVSFYYNLPMDVERPFPTDNSFFDGQAKQHVLEMLENPEQVDVILTSMQPIMESTPEEDRNYNYRQHAWTDLTAYKNGTFTLFPNLQSVTPVIEQATTFTRPEPIRQLNLFADWPPAPLPSVEEQQEVIQQENEPLNEIPPITQEDIDALLIGAIKNPEPLITQFTENFRSKEAAQILKALYGDLQYTMPRIDASDGYLGLLSEDTGIVLSKGAPASEPLADRLPAQTLTLSWMKLHRRVAELVSEGRFVIPEQVQETESSYQVGDIVAATSLDGSINDIVIVDIDEDYITYRFRENDPNPEPVRMRRDEFDTHFQNGDFAVTQVVEPEVVTKPKPVFFVDWQTAQHDFDLRLYNDRDVIGYDQNGVEYALGRSGNITYITNTTTITSWGEVLGSSRIPQDIFEQILAYRNGELTEEQVTQNYRDTLAGFAPVQIEEEYQAEKPSESYPPTGNFRITDEHLGEGGAKTKYQRNVEAIRTLKEIETAGRYATAEEQETLSRYVGWGGLPSAFDENNTGWSKEYQELKSLLTDEEYSMARASTLNAHYTSPTVIKAMYDTIERLGFKTGNISEPACGVGNFFGLLPESMKNSKLYGTELDSITGRIAQQLYPDADINVGGFETTDTPDSFFDLAIGNVPFGSYKVVDKKYDKQNFLIHDYFFAKTLDQVRPGGIVAFITSKGTLDKRNPEVRKYIAQRADLLGAVRLPNNAFLKNAGTEVTSDIIFLQKRDTPCITEPDWVHLGLTEDSIPVNSYFAEHPEMILGTMEYDERMYGNQKETTCKPIDGADLAEQLEQALLSIEGEIREAELDDIEGIADVSIPADPDVRNFSYTVVDDTVYYRENSRMYPVDMPAVTLERVKGMVELRDAVHTLIDYQLYEYSDAEIRQGQQKLNEIYDRFAKDYGLINSTANSRAFSADSAYYLLTSLEVLDENGNLERKADMFDKRTIKQKTVITSVDTSSEALSVSLGQKARVDIPYMQSLTGFTEEKIVEDLQGVIFRVPYAKGSNGEIIYQAADEYLSGNVREKLTKAKQALEYSDIFAPNVKALEAAQPKDLNASEISVRLGSTWVDKSYIQQFMYELLKTPSYLKTVCKVEFSTYTSEWNVSGKGRVSYSDVAANVTYGTKRANAYRIIEDTLNLRDVRIYDIKEVDGKDTRVLNKKETMLAQQKQEQIKRAFKDWIFKDPERRQTLVQLYNEKFNSVRPREYDGSYLEFSGINPGITMRNHQRGAVAHAIYGGNTLLAHEVGAGKTYEMIAIAMESKRLGLCHKSMIAVPNHLTEQWAAEFLRLYPSANILVATKKDFQMANRKKFCAKIATGDYDAVIIGHSQLEKIAMSKERQEQLLWNQIDEITMGLEQIKRNQGAQFTIKQLEKTRKSLEARIKKLQESTQRDDVVTFEQLGVDRLFVDEAHYYKNLFTYTKMRNVAGISQSEAQKSSDLFMKCRYLDELTGGKGIIFATGTPISNSMVEMYTMQRYLQYDTLQYAGLTNFDAWASTFGETVTSLELAPEGTGYRARTRFSRFHNLPELMCMFKEVADIKTADMLDAKDLPRPKATYRTIIAKPTDIQKEMVTELSERAAEVHSGNVDPSVDNMLKITSDGRKIGLDQRLINPMLPDDPNSKVNLCAENVFDVWDKTKPDSLTQLVFCDFSTPNADGRFNVYDDMRKKLIAKGIPEHEIVFIHEANTETKKKELFAKVRQGKVRVLFGSTLKLGSGTNVQDLLIMLHDLDCPWRPSDLEQRAGRIVRQGNNNPEVFINRYATEGTFDAYLWQTVENKQKFISQIMTSKSPVRSCEDVDETSLSYAEIKALCAGNPLIKERMDLDVDVSRLRLMKADYQSQHYMLEDNLLKYYPEQIKQRTEQIQGFEKDTIILEQQTPKPQNPAEPAPFAPMTLQGQVYADKGKAGAALLEVCKTIKSTEPVKIGSYRGFNMHLSFDSLDKTFTLTLKGAMSYRADLGTDSYGNITRINNALAEIAQRLNSVKTHLENVRNQMADAKEELEKPFPQEQELEEKATRLALLDVQLNMDGRQHEETPPAEGVAKRKPSILETLRNNKKPNQSKYGKDKSTDIAR
ncbi:MAG: SNF2-related protein [Lachnospiraceae bacterium]